MPITLSWFDDKHTIILYTFDGKWTWEEFNCLDKPVWDLVAQADYRIDLMLDWTESAGFPMGLMNSMHGAGEDIVPEDEGLVVSIGGPYLIKILFATFKRLYPKAAASYRLVDRLEEGIHLLEHERNKAIQESRSPFK